MSTPHRRTLLAAASVLCLLALSACATAPGGSPAPTSTGFTDTDPLGAVRPAPPDGRVIGAGMVIDVAGDAKLCLGAVAESAPPQCEGVPLDGWSWSGLDGAEVSGDTAWGGYAVYGTYDGDRLTVTDQPIMLALYDPVRPDDPTGGVEGTTSASDLTAIQDALSTALGPAALGLWQERGYVWLQVAWDDGTVQSAVDEEFGPGVVVVVSALREVD